MNRLGIKLYKIDELYIDNIHYTINSINLDERFNYITERYYYRKYRLINRKLFGIELRIINK